MGSYRVDTAQWPIVVHFVDGALTNAQLDAYIHEATAVLQRGEPHVTLFDARLIGNVSALTRRRSREFVAQHSEELARHCVGTVYVLSSPLVRFIVMMSLLVKRLPMPYLVTDSMDEAFAWGRRRYAEAQQQAAVG